MIAILLLYLKSTDVSEGHCAGDIELSNELKRHYDAVAILPFSCGGILAFDSAIVISSALYRNQPR
jgi:hypothetical protein